jgi:hypothetical protein
MFTPIADMKRLHLLLLLFCVAVGPQLGLTGCIIRPGVDEGVYYDGGDRGPWFRDGGWADGRGWRGGGGVYFYPGR